MHGGRFARFMRYMNRRKEKKERIRIYNDNENGCETKKGKRETEKRMVKWG